MGFIPKEAIEAVNDGGSSIFIDLKPGEQKFRILGLRFYYETRTPNNSPIRSKTRLTKIPFNGRFECHTKNGKVWQEKIKYVWAMTVWSYADQEVKVLSLDKATVQKQLVVLDEDEDWGDLSTFDIKIVRKGEGSETKYTVMPSNQKPLPKDIQSKIDNAAINLDAMLYCVYPNDEQWQDKALDKLIKNLDLATSEASKRGIDFEVPASTDLAELQSAWEKALDLMPLQKAELPKVTADDTLEPESNGHSEELDTIPF